MKKRPSLRQSLAKFQQQQQQQQQQQIKGRPEGSHSQTRSQLNKKDMRIVWHQWSDGVRGLIPYRSFPGTTILILGDGDLSFSTSLLNAHGIPGEQLIATCYDDEASLERKYPQRALANRERLLAAGATVILNLDATKLTRKYLSRHVRTAVQAASITPGEPSRATLYLTRIIFNFPHTGEGIKDRSHNIKRQQQLILGVLRAAADLLATQVMPEAVSIDDTITRHTLMARPALAAATDESTSANEGRRTDEGEESTVRRAKIIKTDVSFEEIDEIASIDEFEGHDRPRALYPEPEIHLTSWTGDPYDDWNIKRLVSSNIHSLCLAESFQFDSTHYPGYGHCRTTGDGEEGEFRGRPARTFVFTSRRGTTSDRGLPAMIQILQVMASRGDLLNYLTIFRLLLRLTWSRLERANTSSHRRAQSLVVAHLLVEHLQICFNRFQWHLIDFGEVEACLDDLVELATSTDGSVKDDAKGHANDDGVDVDGQSGHEGSKTRKELATIITMAAQIYYIYIGGPK